MRSGRAGAEIREQDQQADSDEGGAVAQAPKYGDAHRTAQAVPALKQARDDDEVIGVGCMA